MFVLAHMQGMFVWNIGISVYFVTDITVGFVSVGLAITCEAPRSPVIQEYFICKKREEIFELLSLWSKMIKEGSFGHSHVRTCLGCWSKISMEGNFGHSHVLPVWVVGGIQQTDCVMGHCLCRH